MEMLVSDFVQEYSNCLSESKFGKYKNIDYRIDDPNGYPNQQKHVHVGKFTWNLDGTISHIGRSKGEQPTKAQKQAAAKALDVKIEILENWIDANYKINFYSPNTIGSILQENLKNRRTI
jgi:hypothetical protein